MGSPDDPLNYIEPEARTKRYLEGYKPRILERL